LITSLYNRLFKNGEFPGNWNKVNIVVIHKKGDINCPNNFCGISLLDTLWKIYTGILTRRLNFYINVYDKIAEEQARFREGYSTIDNAFILNALIQKQLSKRRTTLCCFSWFWKGVWHYELTKVMVYVANIFMHYKVSTKMSKHLS
jgi:hypothetical protein